MIVMTVLLYIEYFEVFEVWLFGLCTGICI